MRPSKQIEILDAAVRVVGRAGAKAVTLEAVAAEAGMTRGGIKYHFEDREALSVAIQQHLADGWEQQLQSVAGATADQLTLRERAIAYAEVALLPHPPGQYEMVLHGAAAKFPGLPWKEVHQRWTPTAAQAQDDPDALQCFLVCLAADGLWSLDLLGSKDLPASLRKTVVGALRDLLEAPPTR